MLRLLRHARLFAPEPHGMVDVLIADQRIAAIAPNLPDLPPAIPCETVDLQGRRVIPGLIDAHVHVTGGGGEAGPHTRVPPLQLSDMTTAGVTTAIGVLGTDGTTRTMRDLVARTLGLRAEGLSCYCYTGSYEVPPITLCGRVRDDIVFVDPIIGAGEVAISDHRSSQPTISELARLAADCHVAGLMTGKAGILHLHLGDGLRGLTPVQELLATTEIPPRTFHPTHVNRNPRLWDEAKDIVRLGVTIDVTAYDGSDDDGGVSAQKAIAEYLDAGLPPERITVSSDGGGCIPWFDADGAVARWDIGRSSALGFALRALLAEGRPLEQILPAFTVNVARTLRLGRKGRLAMGMDADLVVLDEHNHVHDVMACGRWMVRDGRAIVIGTMERPRS